MSELDDLKNDAEKYAKDHPQQVKEGEEDLEKKLIPGDAQSGQTAAGQEGHSHPEDGQPNQNPDDDDSVPDSSGSH
jgi:hypothetical protein